MHKGFHASNYLSDSLFSFSGTLLLTLTLALTSLLQGQVHVHHSARDPLCNVCAFASGVHHDIMAIRFYFAISLKGLVFLKQFLLCQVPKVPLS